MAQRRYTLVFYAAIGVALLATLGVYRLLETMRAESRVLTRPVVVAAEDLPEGASVGRGSITVVEWPVQTIPTDAYGSVDSVAGRVTRVAVFEGEAIVPGRLAPAGTTAGLEVKIAPGRRAMAVPINEVAGLSGLIQPNSRVDVLVTLRDEEGGSRDQVAKLFMENMRVLSVGTQVQRGADGKPINATTAALEVTPEEAERLAVAARQGVIQLVLRGYGDPDSVKTKGARPEDVLAQLRAVSNARPAPAEPPSARRARPPAPRPVQPPPPPVARPATPESLTVQVFRGEKVTQQKFQKSEPPRTPPR